MKRIGTLLLAFMMLLSVPLFAAAEGNTADNHLTVGNPTAMRGEFFTGMWGNSTSDLDVRDLLHGYNLVMWDGEYDMFVFDPSVVTNSYYTTDAAGDTEYTMTLAGDLRYSDGSRITAWDYAFSLLLQISPKIAELGGVPRQLDYIAGSKAYLNGTPYLSGVRVPNDNTLSITIRKDYLPFFYELGLLSCVPYPIQVIAPGVAVKDNGVGVYLANKDANAEEPVFTADLLRETILDPETGYLSHPSVVSGPYTLTSFDGTTAEFAVNRYYKGNAKGKKPSIDTLTYTVAENETMIEKLESGEFGLINKAMRLDSVEKGIRLTEESAFQMTEYLRTGLCYLSFACEHAGPGSKAVRQAVAWCLDRDMIVQEYLGDHGVRADGYYGVGQWMYGLLDGSVEPPVQKPKNGATEAEKAAYEAAVKPYKALNLDKLTAYAVDTEKAAKLLDEDGWTLNEQGIREKETNGEKVTLELKLIYPEGNTIGETLEKALIPNLEAVGIKLAMEPVPMVDLLSVLYKKDGERDADLIWVASNFDIVFDPALQFTVGSNGEPNWSYTNCEDVELYRLALNMRETEPGDVLGYLKKWISFQERFNETLPMIPVYSNSYFDFYTGSLQDYDITLRPTWGEAIVPAYLK